MSFPSIGMTYRDVRYKLKNYDSVRKHKNKRITDSLINQARLCEGEKAAKALSNEVIKDANHHSGNHIGYSPDYGYSWDRIFDNSSG